MTTSYHVHTGFSDGKAMPADMVRAAVRLGLDELGFSDHFVLLPNGATMDWSMLREDLPRYHDAVREAAAEVEGKLVVRFGIEADYVPETAGELAGILQSYPFDYVIGGVHLLDGFMVDESAGWWAKLTEPERNAKARLYWDRIGRMAQSGLFDIAAHLDVYKKFSILPTVDLSPEISAALDAIAAADMAVEVNTAGWHWTIEEAYPSPAIIRECRHREIPMLINADAHQPAHLTRDFDRARQLLLDAGYTEKAVYAGRKRRMLGL